jgi:Protein of unknown function (DUF3617)
MMSGTKLQTAAILLLGLAYPAFAQSTPRAGSWEISVTQEGMPVGGGTRVYKVCLSAELLTTAPEQVLVDSAGRRDNSSARPGPTKCVLKDVKREASQSSWQSTCEGPRGTIQGKGGGTLEAEQAELKQTFDVDTPIGARTLKQTVRARRLGDC